MKKFRYNLQRILTLKEKKEELLRQELSRLYFNQNQHEKIKSYYEHELSVEVQKIRELALFAPEDREQMGYYMDAIRGNIYNQKIIIQEYVIKIEKKRQEILENRKEIKTMERLKERQLENYNYELMIDERRLMDEIANRKAFNVSSFD